jgi:hypothetical protein
MVSALHVTPEEEVIVTPQFYGENDFPATKQC